MRFRQFTLFLVADGHHSAIVLSTSRIGDPFGELMVEVPDERYANFLYSFVQALLRISDGSYLMVGSGRTVNTTFLNVPDLLAAKFTGMARWRGMSRSALIRDAAEMYPRTDAVERLGSALLHVSDLKGKLSRPENLSVNKNYLRKFGRW